MPANLNLYTFSVLLVLTSGTLGCGNFSRSESPTASPASMTLPFSSDPVSVGSPISPNFIVSIVEQVGPAVVSIDATRSGSRTGNPLFGAPPRDTQGTGSGFILRADGAVLTNAHVVDGAKQVSVVLRDGRRFSGQVVGRDTLTDLAVVKIVAQGLPTVTLGSSRRLAPGQWAIAIGNPLGLNNTVTAGIISAINRSSAEVGAPERRVSFIQTDAAINPGNSGGPLLDQQGKVIGVNTAMIRGAQGLSFAIPIETADRIAKQLLKTGRAEHLYLGVRLVNLTPELKQELNQVQQQFRVQQDQGVLIVEVVPGSPADRSGVQPGDWVARVNDRQISTTRQLQEQVETTQLGNSLKLEVQRQGQLRQFQIRPQPLPANQQL